MAPARHPLPRRHGVRQAAADASGAEPTSTPTPVAIGEPSVAAPAAAPVTAPTAAPAVDWDYEVIEDRGGDPIGARRDATQAQRLALTLAPAPEHAADEDLRPLIPDGALVGAATAIERGLRWLTHPLVVGLAHRRRWAKRRAAYAAVHGALPVRLARRAARGARAASRASRAAWERVATTGRRTSHAARLRATPLRAPRLLTDCVSRGFVLRRMGDLVAVAVTVSVGLYAGMVVFRRGSGSPALPAPAARLALPATTSASGGSGMTTATSAVGAPAPSGPVIAGAAGATVAAGNQDWADSVTLPEWVRRPVASGAGAAAVPFGDGRSVLLPPAYSPTSRASIGAAGVAPAYGDAASVGGPVQPIALVPRLLERMGGPALLVHELGLGRDGWQRGALGVPGRCADAVLADRDPGAPELGARELRGVSEWLFALAVPAETCAGASRRAATRMVPTAAERAGLARATAAGDVVARLGAPAFAGSELRELQVATIDGVRMAWGVFRRPPTTTQIIPPPAQPQLAFVAALGENGWEIVWAKYAEAAGEVVGLAGVLDATGTGMPDAFFAVKAPGGALRVLVIGRDGAGQWALRRTLPL